MPHIATRKLGKAGPEVPALGFGLMGLSIGCGDVLSDEVRFALLDRAYDLGVRFWDSADMYGDSEELVGKWFKRSGNRDEFGVSLDMKTQQSTFNSSPSYAKEACYKSLERLGIDFIDLYYCHRCDLETPIEKTVEAMVELKNEGKIKYLGLSEISSTTLRRACAVHHIDAVQVEYSPFALDIEDPTIALLTTCRELGVAIVSYSPLGRGFLTGAYKKHDDFGPTDFRRLCPRLSEDNFPKNLKLVHELDEVARKKGCLAGQLSLAWLMAQGEDIIPIPGTRKIRNLEENVEAMNIVLTDEEIAHIRKIVDAVEVHGERYPTALSAGLFADTLELEQGIAGLLQEGSPELEPRIASLSQQRRPESAHGITSLSPVLFADPPELEQGAASLSPVSSANTPESEQEVINLSQEDKPESEQTIASHSQQDSLEMKHETIALLQNDTTCTLMGHTEQALAEKDLPGSVLLARRA